MWDADPALKEYINHLDPEKIGELVAFSTAGGQNVALNKIVELATARGIKVSGDTLLIKMLLRGHKTFGQTGGKLTDKHIAEIKNFAMKFAE
jgi:hypothetical protein